MGKRFHVSKPRKCKRTGKTMFEEEKQASRAMMRVWSHDTSMNIYDYHTYLCPDCKTYHFGNKRHYEKTQNVPAPIATNVSEVGTV